MQHLRSPSAIGVTVSISALSKCGFHKSEFRLGVHIVPLSQSAGLFKFVLFGRFVFIGCADTILSATLPYKLSEISSAGQSNFNTEVCNII